MTAIEPEELYSLWIQLAVLSQQSVDTPLAQAFFSARNGHWLRNEMTRRLREALNEPNALYVFTEEFVTSMVEIVLTNPGLGLDVRNGLPLLNQWILDKEFEIAVLGQRQRKRYETQMLQGNRMRVMPYGLGDKTLHVKGENQMTQAPYQLNHPFKSQYQAFLQQVMNINNPIKASTCSTFQPRFPQP